MVDLNHNRGLHEKHHVYTVIPLALYKSTVYSVHLALPSYRRNRGTIGACEATRYIRSACTPSTVHFTRVEPDSIKSRRMRQTIMRQ